MPPTRRHSRTTTPQVRRPRVAGLRRPNAASTTPQDVEPEALELDTQAVAEPEVDQYAPPVWREPEQAEDPVDEPVDKPVDELVDEVETAEPEIDEAQRETGIQHADQQSTQDELAILPVPPPKTAAKPTGKRRSAGAARPADLAEAEAEVGQDTDRSTPNWTLVWTVTLVVVAVLFAGLAVWFRGEANSRSEGADTNNQALTDTGEASKAVGQLRVAIEKSLTYNYTDLDSTARAVKENLSGKALCEYDKLFGQVQKLAPEQKLVLTTRVREIGITRLEGDHAQLLVFVDQTTTRADQNQTTASGAQFGINAERQDGKWRITAFDMLGQPLPNGQPAPQC